MQQSATTAKSRDLRPGAGADTRAPPRLRLQNLGLRAGDHDLLQNISADLAARGISVVLGPNGAGKTLLLRLCHGLLRPTAGRVRWGALSPSQAGGRIAMVFQHPLLMRRSVLANVSFALAARGVPWRERRPRAMAALIETGLESMARRPARRLSGGERQRLGIARVLAMGSDIVLLDEPSANLDPEATHRVEQLVARLRERGGKVIMTTHDLGQARRLADEVLFLHQGRLLEQAAAADFFAGARTPQARAFLAGELLT